MKIERKWHDLVLDGEEIADMEELESALENNITEDLLDELFDLYKKGYLQLWLRSQDEADKAEALDKLVLSGDKVENLYDICYCLYDDVEKDDIAEAVIGSLELDGEEIEDMEELAEHPSTELLDLYNDGTLQLWLRYHDGDEEADELDRLTLSGDEAQDLYAVCQAVGILITLEDIREALEEQEEWEDSDDSDDSEDSEDSDESDDSDDSVYSSISSACDMISKIVSQSYKTR